MVAGAVRMSRPAWTEASNRPGPRPSRLPYGGGECQAVVAADLSPSLQSVLRDCPDSDFPRHGFLKVAKILDSAVRRGFIEPCGYHAGGLWQYRLTDFGKAVREALP